MSEKLKSCPFCGIDARVEQLGGKYTVGCVTVDCIGHYYSGKLYKEQSAAVEAWNRRANDGADE